MRLTKLEESWLAAELGAIFPGDDAGVPSIASMDIPGFFAEVMRRVSFQAAIGLRAAIWIAAFAPLFLLGRLATIRSLSEADRTNVLTKLLASKSYGVRSLVMFLKTIGALLYCADASVRARMYAHKTAVASGERPVALRLKGQAA